MQADVPRASRPATGSAEFLYVDERTAVGAYRINVRSGALKKIEGAPYFCAYQSDGLLTADPVANYLYCSALDTGIVGYSINPTTGALTTLSGSPFSDPYGKAYQLAITPNGAFLYAGSFTQPNQYPVNNITAYTIDSSTGALSVIKGSPFMNGEVQSYSMVVTPSGNFLYLTESGTIGQVSGFSINASKGSLTPISGSPFAAELNPRSLAVGPSGAFLYVPGLGSDPSIAGTISVYAINPGSGTLSEIKSSPYSNSGGPYAVAVTPSGKYAYVTLAYSNEVAAYSIGLKHGGLTQIKGSPFPTGEEPIYAAVDPSGRFLYVSNVDSFNIWGYKISARNGKLTRVRGSPFPTGTSPPGDIAIAVPH